jgi:hypothetical protein
MRSIDIKFATTVNTNALLQVNPKEFYTAALLENRSSAMFRQVLNLKEKTKIGSLSFGEFLFEAGCDYQGSDSTLDAKEMDVCKLQLGTDLCVYDLETSFVADWMKAGSNNADFLPGAFSTHFYGELQRELSQKLEYLTWQGDTSGATSTYLDLCDGLLIKLRSGSIPTDQYIAGTTITSTNVIAELKKVYDEIPVALRTKKADILWFVAPNVADAYRLAVATQSAEMYTTKEAPLTYLGYTLTVGEGMPESAMTLSLKSNYVFLADLVSDPSNINVIDMRNTTGDFTIRVRSDFKVGFDYLNDNEWVVYKIGSVIS